MLKPTPAIMPSKRYKVHNHSYPHDYHHGSAVVDITIPSALPACFILPSAILEQVIKAGTEDQRNRALKTLGISERLRGQRHAFFVTRPHLFASGTSEKHRIIYDMNHSDDVNLLPGKKYAMRTTLVAKIKKSNAGGREADNAFQNTGVTYDFYNQIFKRNSVDGAGAILISSINFGVDFDNAFWNGKQMVFGNGGGGIFKSGSLTAAIDVIAHELTHGVTNYTADLAYTGESGGLNEAISDIFGIMCKQWINKQKVSDYSWLIGEGMLESGGALRDMKGEEKPNPYDRSIFSYKDYQRGMMFTGLLALQIKHFT